MSATIFQNMARAYQVVQTEVQTGILLTVDGKRSLDGRIDVVPANSLEDARRIAKVIVEKKPQVECSIRDYRGIHIEFVRKDISGP